MEIAAILFLFFIILILCLIFSNIRVVPQAYAYVIERLGAYNQTWGAGLHVKIPIIDRVARKVNLKERVADFAPQPVITKDNVTMRIDSVVYFKIFEPRLFAYGVENPIMAMENLTATTLRNIIGDMTLDDTLTSRERINGQMLAAIDAATDPWGIKVNRVEVKNIDPPAAIKEAMEKQMKAERDKRAEILTSEGHKQSMILEAQGKKESALLNAEAEKQATILRAEAVKEKEIKEAEGRAQAIMALRQAEANGLKALKEAAADDAVLKLRALDAFTKAADGQATKIIIPSEIQGIAGLAEGITSVVKHKE